VLDENGGNTVMASQLNNIRLKLEETTTHRERKAKDGSCYVEATAESGKGCFLASGHEGKNIWDYFECIPYNLGSLHNTH